jgi:hypothetical protein
MLRREVELSLDTGRRTGDPYVRCEVSKLGAKYLTSRQLSTSHLANRQDFDLSNHQ